jgi:hypothetical protein
LLEIVSRALGTETHIGKCEIIRDDSAPAVRAELDGVIHLQPPDEIRISKQFQITKISKFL